MQSGSLSYDRSVKIQTTWGKWDDGTFKGSTLQLPNGRCYGALALVNENLYMCGGFRRSGNAFNGERLSDDRLSDLWQCSLQSADGVLDEVVV